MAEKKPTTQTPSERLAALLYKQACPLLYKCLASDCMECLEMHADMEGETDGQSEN